MILHVILVSVLSASSTVTVDSVRAPLKQGVARPDSVLLMLPAPAIKSPAQPESRIVAPVTLAWPTKKTDVKAAEPGTAVPDVAQTAAAAAKPTNEVVISTTSHVAVQSNSQLAAQPASTEVLLQAAAAKPVTLTIAVAAPADASAVALPPRTSAPTTPPAPITTADGRVVLSTRSTVVVEPLHAVPLPVVGVRLAPPSLADSLVVYKRERTLTLFLRGVPVRSYFVALGSRPVGDKVSAGDDRTPEGLFFINAHNPASKYHLALRISYPDDVHRERAAKLGVDPGGDIMIHGLPLKFKDAGKDHRLDDWTNGCVALTNQEIEEIWHAVPDGTPIQIKP